MSFKDKVCRTDGKNRHRPPICLTLFFQVLSSDKILYYYKYTITERGLKINTVRHFPACASVKTEPKRGHRSGSYATKRRYDLFVKQKSRRRQSEACDDVVRLAGFEPARFPRRILSPLCMPFHHNRIAIILHANPGLSTAKARAPRRSRLLRGCRTADGFLTSFSRTQRT